MLFVRTLLGLLASFAAADGASPIVSRTRDGTGLCWRNHLEEVRVAAYGRDSIRVTMTNARRKVNLDGKEVLGAILATPEVQSDFSRKATSIRLRSDGAGGNVTNGVLRAVVAPVTACCSGGGAAGLKALRLTFYRGSDVLLDEFYPLHGEPARTMFPYARGAGDLFRAKLSFSVTRGERFYGLGQHQHNGLSIAQNGNVIALDQVNTEVSVPFLLSSIGYGFAFNVPSQGRVELSSMHTTWVSVASRQVDYLVMASPSETDLFSVLTRLAEATGHAPEMPDFAVGYWQCKDRYASAKEVLNVTKEFAARQLPVSVLVIDDDPAFSPHIGDWKLNSNNFSAPSSMYKEIHALVGAAVMVSAWPTVATDSVNWDSMFNRGLLACAETGSCNIGSQLDIRSTIIDQFQEETRDYFWLQLKKNHLDQGASLFWLDADEGCGSLGEDSPYPRADAVFASGSAAEVCTMFPYQHQRAVFEGWKATEGSESMPMTLSRSAWLGSQRWGAAVWSGDTMSSWEYLRIQIPAGLNMQMSGIPWWTFDIGGFFVPSGSTFKNEDPEFRELLVRWFQLGTFTSIMRMHGSRTCDDKHGFETCPNEPWSFGMEVEKILVNLIHYRENKAFMRPYVSETMAQASKYGRPPQRPLFFDFPEDTIAVEINDQYMFGDRLLVAPITEYKQRYRKVWLPGGKDVMWSFLWETKEGGNFRASHAARKLSGGQWVNVSAPLNIIPVYIRANGQS